MSQFLEIRLTARRGNWRKYYARKQNKRFQKLAQQIFKRDQYTCRYCGFIAGRFNEVVNIDQNYDNNTLDNMVTACGFCAQCFFLDNLGFDSKTGGSIIHLPELSQAQLNNFCRVLFCALDKQNSYKAKLQAVYLSLRDRNKNVENCFGPNSSEPRIFGQGLIDAGLNEQQLNHNLLLELRLLPSRKAFSEQIEYWKATVFSKVPL